MEPSSRPQDCIEPHHHVNGADEFVRAVERACRSRGLRLTPIRAYVLDLIAKAGKPLKAYDLLDLVREGGGPGAAAPPTVYRALDFLLGNGFIHKLQSVNAFVACHHPSATRHSSPFLICDHCREAVELEDVNIIALLQARAQELGFVAQAQTLEVHGLCASCARARTAGVRTARASRGTPAGIQTQ